jgi:N utilization substance protein A
LSLAIGKKGQNVRLASRLSGWNLEVRSESESEDEARRARLSLSAISGVGDVTAELLFQHGFKSAEEVAQADEAALAEVDGIPEEKIPAVLAAARAHVEQLQREAAAAAAAVAAEEAAEPLVDDALAHAPALSAEPEEHS